VVLSVGRPLLAIDASAARGSAAIVDGARVLAEIDTPMRGEASERLMPAVAHVLLVAGIEPSLLAAVVCGAGPGGFTGLRLAAAIAKGIAASTGVRLAAVSSLLLIATGGERPLPAGAYLVTLDAMRDERFIARVRVDSGERYELAGETELIAAASVARIAREEGRRVVGPGESIDLAPHAGGSARLANCPDAIVAVDLETWEPGYGRLAEAQARWERDHGRSLPS
jgi:tRNA threonylcarbamoyladenosine biosynthesis protein TsaB